MSYPGSRLLVQQAAIPSITGSQSGALEWGWCGPAREPQTSTCEVQTPPSGSPPVVAPSVRPPAVATTAQAVHAPSNGEPLTSSQASIVVLAPLPLPVVVVIIAGVRLARGGVNARRSEFNIRVYA